MDAAQTPSSGEWVAVGIGGAVLAALGMLRFVPSVRHLVFARLWSDGGASARMDEATREAKRELLSHPPLFGRVLDLGTGDGHNIKYLCGVAAPDVRELVCVEPNRYLQERLRTAAAAAQEEAADAGIELRVSVFEGTLEEYEAHAGKDGVGSFDTITCLLVLCSVPDVREALASCARLLRRAERSRLLYLEHVCALSLPARTLQRAVQPAWDFVGDGCQLCRDTLGEMARVGASTGAWEVTTCKRELRFVGGLVPVVHGSCTCPGPSPAGRRA